jgi:DNA-binding response OmpR family regulator
MPYLSKILLVDDDPAGLETLEDLLIMEDYRLATAVSGQEALEKTNLFIPDLILLDVMMPGMDGYEVCRLLRAQPRTAEIPIILLTALDDRQSRLRGIEVGADDFISKPYDRIELRARVRTITKLNRFRNISTERAKFEMVVNNSDSAYLLINESGQATFANPKAIALLGANLHPVENQLQFIDLVQEIYLIKSANAWQNWPEPPLENEVRYLVRPATNSARTLWLHVDTIEKFPGPEGFLWMIQIVDVTDQMISQHSMWKFHAAINHKLRTPLVGLYSGLEILAADGLSMDPEMLQEMLNLTYGSSRRLYTEIEDILTFINTPTFIADGHATPVNQLKSLIIETVSHHQLQPAEIRIEHEQTVGHLALSPQSMELILAELIENSKKFHPQNAPHLIFTIQINNHNVILTLMDDGQHLMPEELNRVWQPYYQVERTFSGEIAGMGLGLASVATIIWGAGGSCDMQNRDDCRGTSVTLTIPTHDD